MKVAVLVSGDAKFDGRVLKETQTLREAGHDVSLIDQGAYSPSAFDRARYLSRAVRRMLALKPDAVHANDLDTLPAGIAVKKLTGARVTYDCHEFFSEMVKDTDWSGASVLFSQIEPMLLEHVDAVIAANEGIADYLQAIDFGKVEVIHNYAYRPNGYVPPYDPRFKGFILIYIGTLQRGRMIAEAADVVMRLPGARMMVWGAKSDARRILAKAKPEKIVVVPHMVPNEEVVGLMTGAHAVLGLYDPSRFQNANGMPNKVYEAMAAGRPCIVSASTAAGDLVNRVGCGLSIPYDASALAETLLTLIAQPEIAETLGRTGYEAARDRYNWEHEEPKLLRIYERLG